MTRRLTVRGRDLVAGSGVGAIVEIGRQSFVTTDLAHWGGGRFEGQPVEHPRLARRLGVETLRSATGAGEMGRLGPAYVRFPAWVVCERCGAMRRLESGEYGIRQPMCDACRTGALLIGVRWIGACPQGHLFDVPWVAWAHLNQLKRVVRDPACRGRRGLRLRSQGRGGATDGSLVVECRDCGAASSLLGLIGKGTLAEAGMATCPGTQPWSTGSNPETCDEVPHVMMRASSRVHFPKVVSMLDIPPDADRRGGSELENRIRQEVNGFQLALWKDKRGRGVEIDDLDWWSEQLGCSKSDIEAFLDAEIAPASGAPVVGTGSLDLGENADSEFASRMEEWRALVTPRPDAPSGTQFRTEHLDVDELGLGLDRLVRRLVLIHRLREVRAYYGYRRIYNDGDRSRLMRPARETGPGRIAASWVPAHEVSGEGIFLELDTRAVADWSARQVDPEVRSTRETVHGHFEDSYLSSGPNAIVMSQPEFVLVHTLSHLLIREMAYSAGYTAASMRERLYVGPTGADRAVGILIYTADGDSEGTLGGLVELGRPKRLRSVVENMLERAAWCGQDPVCAESQGQGVYALNLAACHGCCLLSETSCDHANVMLDRNTLISRREGAPGLMVDLLG